MPTLAAMEDSMVLYLFSFLFFFRSSTLPWRKPSEKYYLVEKWKNKNGGSISANVFSQFAFDTIDKTNSLISLYVSCMSNQEFKQSDQKNREIYSSSRWRLFQNKKRAISIVLCHRRHEQWHQYIYIMNYMWLCGIVAEDFPCGVNTRKRIQHSKCTI